MSLTLEPAYGTASLAEVLPAVSHALGARVPGWELSPRLGLPEAPSYVVVLIDGLGSRLIERHPAQTPFLSSLTGLMPATCGVPSTTASSLATLGTALPPGAHGLVGFTSRIPGTSQVMQLLQWDASVDPLEYQPHETAFARIAAAGVATSVLSKPEFETSGLTRAAQRGAAYVGGAELADRIDAAVDLAATSPSLTYVYDSDLDATGHLHGVDSSQWRLALDDVDAALEGLRERLPAHTRLLVVADHGMVDAGERIDIDQTPALSDGVALLAGEARLRHVHVRSGAAGDVQAAWREVLGERALVLTREEAIARGWFGAVEGRVEQRLGDLVVAALGDTALFASRRFSFEAQLTGLHGSITADEMAIPLLLG